MPELPEVETTRRGIAPFVTDSVIHNMIIRDRRLRRPISENLPSVIIGQRLIGIDRRAKYLLWKFETGTILIHLGMSGSLRFIPKEVPPEKHDHVDLVFANGHCVRYRDPRRFGLVLWLDGDPAEDSLLAHLGPEPWDESFSAEYLYRRSRGRRAAIKNFIMDGKIIVGVGNIYASESLHRAGIDPRRAANRISKQRYLSLYHAIIEILDLAIAKGGTTLKDFLKSDGKPGYFRNELKVYDRAGEPCECGKATIRQIVIGQRSSFFCPKCQR